MNRKVLLRITSLFFALMICFTVLSRAADQFSVAVVTAARPENRMITHEVRTSGKIVQNQELAVTTQPDQRVSAIYVSLGDRVKKGDLLFEVDLGLLEEQILNQQQEMEKQQLTVDDAKSQKSVSAQQKASQQAQAAENYALSVKSAGVRLERAKEALAEAKKELKKFRRQAGVTQEDSSVEETLIQTCEEKTDAYIKAQQELTTLQWNIENAVNTAMQNASYGASLSQNEPVYTQSSDAVLREAQTGVPEQVTAEETVVLEEPLIIEAPEETANESNTGTSGSGTGQPGGNAGAETDGTFTDDILIDSITEETGDIILEEPEPPVSAEPPVSTEPPVSAETPPSQEELDQIEQSVRSSYEPQLQAALQKVEDARTEKEEALQALAEYQQEQLAAGDTQNAQAEAELTAKVEAAQQEYEDAALAANEAAVTSGRAVQQAGIPDAQNSSDRMSEITYEQMELQLEKLEQLKADGGKVTAPADGLITKINIMTGEKTTDTTALLMADLSKGYRFTAELTKEQEQYIGTGDLVTLKGNGRKQVLEEVPVESVTADEEDENVYHVTAQLPEDSDVFELGESVSLEFGRQSEAYPVCVPLSAIHLDTQNRPYVLVAETYDSVMGTETRARKVSVTVQEQNESYAALGEGAISTDQEVIISSDKAVDDGSRIRLSGADGQ
ncbi:MAG TPA: hypothetical protein IAB97_08360 [Candidatus Choladousia intestinipullorum]|nr:hypothetical protein [Candidatus Choladousia intestinipullorum]